MDGCEPLRECWASNPGPPQEWQVLSAAEPAGESLGSFNPLYRFIVLIPYPCTFVISNEIEHLVIFKFSDKHLSR